VGPGMVTILSTSPREKISSEKLYTSDRYESERIRLSFFEWKRVIFRTIRYLTVPIHESMGNFGVSDLSEIWLLFLCDAKMKTAFFAVLYGRMIATIKHCDVTKWRFFVSWFSLSEIILEYLLVRVGIFLLYYPRNILIIGVSYTVYGDIVMYHSEKMEFSVWDPIIENTS
jgi:hypothetical protein